MTQPVPAQFPIIRTALTGVAVVALVVGSGMIGCPSYNVWSAEMRGKAELAQADQNRQIQIAVSKAHAESATYEAQAEVNRANGAAQAIKITGSALQTNPEYLRYLYVNNLAESHDQIIYVPTEAGMPILEAGRVVNTPHQDATPAKTAAPAAAPATK